MRMKLVIAAAALFSVLLFRNFFVLDGFYGGGPAELQITIPAGHTEGFIYAEEEISPMKHTLIVRTAEGTPDGEVMLKGVEVKEENAYEPAYITAGFPTQIPLERWAWFKIGLNIPNPTDEDLVVTLRLQSTKLRIE